MLQNALAGCFQVFSELFRSHKWLITRLSVATSPEDVYGGRASSLEFAKEISETPIRRSGGDRRPDLWRSSAVLITVNREWLNRTL